MSQEKALPSNEKSSRNTVDANMSLLRKRIDEVRMKERLERCCRSELGWNYAAEYNPKLRRDKAATELFELIYTLGHGYESFRKFMIFLRC
ncbi:hypothetical protein CRG98_011222 [Punica granatum]|uniref:Uncharacterized protein n=1 Tax=Punica granatum TaxID=22663 RepID=A0A2I0KIS6_PUNGR|nr:hypothetical protein CRG98_011222 [Punica granatum]